MYFSLSFLPARDVVNLRLHTHLETEHSYAMFHRSSFERAVFFRSDPSNNIRAKAVRGNAARFSLSGSLTIEDVCAETGSPSTPARVEEDCFAMLSLIA